MMTIFEKTELWIILIFVMLMGIMGLTVAMYLQMLDIKLMIIRMGGVI